LFGGLFGTGGRNNTSPNGPGTDEWQTRYNDDGNLVIAKYSSRSDVVVIPAEFEGIPVVEIGEKAFSGNTAIRSVTIPEGITIIPKDAFDGCTRLTSIAIPASVIRIGANGNDAEDAFDGCTGLASITVAGANGVYSAENAVLFNKDKTTLLLCPEGKSGSYTIPSSVTDVTYCAFEGCARLTGVTIPNNVTSIGELAFYNCTGLTSITIPASVKTITGAIRNNDKAYGAFVNCTGLTSVTISDGVTSIGATAFFRCTGLTSIAIPNSVTSIGERAFFECTGLTSITIPASVKTITGAIRNNDQAYGAFVNCTGLTSITISEGITSIGATAFLGCARLTSITIPDSVTYIGGNAFARCISLTSVTISPVEGRQWDILERSGWGHLIFRDCFSLNNASKAAIRNAGYQGQEL
jgi:hypothetical protein